MATRAAPDIAPHPEGAPPVRRGSRAHRHRSAGTPRVAPITSRTCSIRRVPAPRSSGRTTCSPCASSSSISSSCPGQPSPAARARQRQGVARPAHYPPQSIAEEVFFEDPPAGVSEGDADRPPRPRSESDLPAMEDRNVEPPPVRARAAGESRVVFEWPDGFECDYTLAGVLEAVQSMAMNVPPGALPRQTRSHVLPWPEVIVIEPVDRVGRPPRTPAVAQQDHRERDRRGPRPRRHDRHDARVVLASADDDRAAWRPGGRGHAGAPPERHRGRAGAGPEPRRRADPAARRSPACHAARHRNRLGAAMAPHRLAACGAALAPRLASGHVCGHAAHGALAQQARRCGPRRQAAARWAAPSRRAPPRGAASAASVGAPCL